MICLSDQLGDYSEPRTRTIMPTNTSLRTMLQWIQDRGGIDTLPFDEWFKCIVEKLSTVESGRWTGLKVLLERMRGGLGGDGGKGRVPPLHKECLRYYEYREMEKEEFDRCLQQLQL